MLDGVTRRPAAVRGACFALCLAGFLISWAVWAPGFMSPDSYHQWTQVKSGAYADDHPTIMVLLWRAVHVLQEGPSGLLFLHLAVFWLSLLSLALRLLPRLGPLSASVLLVGFAPPVFGSLGAIWKDIGLGVALLAALALVARLHERFTWPAASLAALCLVYAQTVRHNGPAAVVPFWIVLAVLALRHVGRPATVRRVAVLAAALLAVASVAVKSFEAVALRPERTFFAQNLMLHDLAAFSACRQEMLVPEVHRDPDMTLPALTATYEGDSRCYDTFFYGKYLLRRVPTEDATRSLARLWLREVAADPLTYLRHRSRLFLATLGWGQGPCRPHQVLHLRASRESSGLALGVVGPVQTLFAELERLPLLFTPWVYVALSLALFVLGWRSPAGTARTVVLVASSSAVLYVLLYFFVTVCCDFRYSWWTGVASLVAACVQGSALVRGQGPARVQGRAPAS